jgi:hypothetical protein
MRSVAPRQLPITLAGIEVMLASRPRRMQIAREWPELLHAPKSGSGDWSVVLPFCETLRNAFELMCPVDSSGLQRAKNGRCYAFLRDSIHMDEVELTERVKSWHAKVGQYVAIRDCLALSFAIDYDRERGDPKQRQTHVGSLRARAKPYDREPSDATYQAADGLVDECLRFLGEMSCYDSVDAIFAMPPSNPSKSFDLPSYLASAIGERWGRENLSGAIATVASRPPLKNLAMSEKLRSIAGTLRVNSGAVAKRTVLLIDDLYQSGVSMNYAAMELMNAGCVRVLGLTCEKTCTNDDNVSRATS